MESLEAGHGATCIAVLLIEEQPARLLELEQALAPLCVRLVRVASDESALQAIEREDFALVLVGLQRDGPELVRRLRARERTRHTPVLVVLREDADAARLHARSSPWDTVDLVCEPVDPGALRARVAALVELHARSERLQGLLDDVAGERSRLLDLLRQVPAAIAITRGPDFVFEFANPAYEQLAGRRVVPGQTLREAVPEVYSQPEVMAVVRRVMATGEAFVGREFKVDVDRRGDGICEESFFDVIYQPVRVDGRVEALLTHAVDVTQQVLARKAAEAAEAKARFLAEAGERLAVSLDVDAVLGEVARLAVPGIADWSSVDLLTEDGRVERLVLVSREDARVQASREALRRWPHDVRSGPSPVSQVLRTGAPLLVPEVSEADFASWSTTPEHLALVRSVGLCSLLCVPLKARGRVLGALTLAQAESGRRFSEEDTRLVMELARRASLSLDNALLYREAWRAQERYRSFILATSRMAWTADARGNIVEDSPSWRAFTGQTEAEYLGRGWLDAVHPEDRARVDEAWSRATTSTMQGAYEAEYRVRRPDGTYTPTMARGAPVFAPDGTLREWVGANEDLTAKKAVEAERERLAATVAVERERLSRLVEQFPIGVTLLLKGSDGRLRYVTASESYLAIASKRREELLGRTPRQAFPEMEGQGFFELIERVYAKGEAVSGVGAPVAWDSNGDGWPEEHFVDFFYTPLRSLGGDVEGVLIVVSIVDERVRAEGERARLLGREKAARAEAEEANRLKDEFLSTVSHELRTPLTSMLGWVQMLRMGRLPEEKRERALETIERNARAQAQLIEDLLDVSRIMTGKLRLDVAPVDVSAVVEQALESVRPAADARGVYLRSVLDSSGTVQGDATRLQQVVWNLLSNAVKFTPRGGRVQVFVERRDAAVEITVADTGQGIPPDFLPHVFERFRQADAGTTRKHGGLGLGLSIVRHLVEMHGGSVHVSSGGVGRGATFLVRLPQVPPARVEEAPRHVADTTAPESAFTRGTELGGLSILVVDDEEDARELLCALLEDRGASVLLASSAREGLEVLRDRRPDLLLSDIGMPGEDGYALIRQVRALVPEEGGHTPAVALTAFARPEDRTRALLEGYQAHCSKPVSSRELLAALASLAGRTSP